ncbi:MAG: hypothetical protein E7366_05555 [Clostridiales bacterium]|nr:hypothetical protein [Clostridiales bacterium]
MKKLTFAMLALLTSVVVLAGCNGGDVVGGGNKAKIVGKEGAQLLLAEQRLNEKLLKNKGDIFEDGVKTMRTLSERAVENLQVTVPEGYAIKVERPVSYKGLDNNTQIVQVEKSGSLGEEKQDIGKMEIVGDTVVWSDLGEVSNSYEYFLNLTNNIVINAEVAADMIDFVKKNLRVVDKWIVLGQTRYYLHVGENEELLCCEDNFNGTLDVIRRYRNEDGKDVYELYRDRGSGPIDRMTYIAGERYELTMGDHYFSAYNTKGYWENYVLGADSSHINASYLIMKEDICYTFGFAPEREELPALTILSADRQTDILLNSVSGNSMSMVLYLCAFDGIVNVTAPKSEAGFGEGYAYVTGSDQVKINTINGKAIQPSTTFMDGKLQVNGINLMAYVYGYAGEIFLNIHGDSYQDCEDTFKNFLSEYGLTCRRDLDAVLSGISRAQQEIRHIMKYFQWNGIVVSSEEAIREAINVEKARTEEMYGYYTAVKDAEEVDSLNMQEMELNINFASIVENVATGGRINGKEVVLESLSMAIEDTTLFVKDEPYRLTLALEDSAGGLIHLEQADVGTIKYAEETRFTVTASDIRLTLPHLPKGQYRLVGYISTADGIRSSQFAAVAIEAVEGLPVEMGDVDLTAENVNGALILTYQVRTDVKIAISTENKISYAQFEELVKAEVFAYGIPSNNVIEVLNGETYLSMTGEESEIADGIYRIEYTIENGQHKTNGYVYVTYTCERMK